MSFLRTVAPFFHQAEVWAVLLRHFHFWQVMVIHSADVDGYSLLNRLQTQFQSNDDEGEQREIKVSIGSIQIQQLDFIFDSNLSISIKTQLCDTDRQREMGSGGKLIGDLAQVSITVMANVDFDHAIAWHRDKLDRLTRTREKSVA